MMTLGKRIDDKLREVLNPDTIPPFIKAHLGYVMIIAFILIFFPDLTIEVAKDEFQLLALHLADYIVPITFLSFGSLVWWTVENVTRLFGKSKFLCPHCGKKSKIVDGYCAFEGHTSWCFKCGRTIEGLHDSERSET